MSDANDDIEDVEVISYLEDEPASAPSTGAADAGVELAPPPATADVEWLEENIRGHLELFGEGLHGVFGRAEKDWLMTQKDLDRIGGPLTRILNRYDATRAIAAASDPIALAAGTGTYAVRSVLQARAADMARREDAEQELEEDQAGYDDVPESSQGSSNGDRVRGAAAGLRTDLRFPQAAGKVRLR